MAVLNISDKGFDIWFLKDGESRTIDGIQTYQGVIDTFTKMIESGEIEEEDGLYLSSSIDFAHEYTSNQALLDEVAKIRRVED